MNETKFSAHSHWCPPNNWNNLLNNLRLIIQPFIGFNLIKLWLDVFPIPQLSWGFPRLIALMNEFPSCLDFNAFELDLYFSSASE